MNDFLTKNLDALSDPKYALLRQRITEISEKEEKALAEMDETAGFTAAVTLVADRKILFGTKEGQTYQLDSLYDTNQAMDLWYESQTTISYHTKCVMFGFGNGMYVRKYLTASDASTTILVYEPDFTIFYRTISYFDCSDLFACNRLTLIVGDAFEMAAEDYLYKYITYDDIKNCIYQAYPNYSKLYPKVVLAFDKSVQDMLIGVRATRSVLGRYGRANGMNSLRNTRKFAKSKSLFDFYRRCPKNVPVFVVASGPSLDRNVELLREVKGHGIIFACDSALPPLLKRDIIPDLFITLDSKKSKKHTADERTRDIPCVMELESNSGCLKGHSIKYFFLNDLNPYVNKFMRMKQIELPVFTTGGSVANSACAILTSMGFENIILLGQDLAYTGGKAHATGTESTFGVKDTEEDNTVVEGYYGGTLQSSTEFMLYKRWFENEIRENPDVHFYNCTEGGAKIKGAIQIPLREAVDKLCTLDFDFAKMFEETAPLFTDEQREEFLAYMRKLRKHLEKRRDEIKEGICDYDKLMDLVVARKTQSGQAVKLLKKTSALSEELEKAREMYYVFCFVQQELQDITENIYEVKGTVSEEVTQSIRMGKDYLTLLLRGIDELLGYEQLLSFRHPLQQEQADNNPL